MKCSKSGKGAFLVSLVLMVLFTGVALGQGPNAKAQRQGLTANETNQPNVPGGLIMVMHDSEVGKLTQEICKTNKTKFPDCNQVMPGDTVRVEAKNGAADIYTVEPWMKTAKNGCIWQIAKMHLFGEVYTATGHIPAPGQNASSWWQAISTSNPSSATPMPEKSEADSFPWGTALAVLLIILLIILLIWLSTKYLRHPANFPSVIAGGLSSNPAKAASQLADRDKIRSKVNPIVLTELGILNCFLRTPKTFRVQMQFGDGKTRKVDIRDGDSAYRVTRQDGSVEYYRTQCGNVFGIIGLGRANFWIPSGWEFIVENSWTKPVTAATQPPTPQANTAQAAPAVAPAPTASEMTLAPATLPTPAKDEAKPTATSEVQLPPPASTGDEKQHSIKVEISDGTNTITVTATGDKANMPTRVEHTPGAKTVVFFPKGDGDGKA